MTFPALSEERQRVCDAKISPPPPRAPSAEHLRVARLCVRSTETPRSKPPPPSSWSAATASLLLSLPLPARLQCTPRAGLGGRPQWGLGSPLLHGTWTPRPGGMTLGALCCPFILPAPSSPPHTHIQIHTHRHKETHKHRHTHIQT